MCFPPRRNGKRTAAAVTAEYHWSESKNCYVPIALMHPQWARNALNKFVDDREPANEIDRIYIKNLLNRATTPANRISDYVWDRASVVY